MSAPSPVVWVRWLLPPNGSEIGEVDRLPRVVAEVFIARGDAVAVAEADVPASAKKRRPS